MKAFGNRSKFAIEVALECVEVYVAGRRLTEVDNQPYMQAFATRIRFTWQHLERCLNFQANEDRFVGMGVDEAYRALASADGELPRGVFDAQRFADWGPITDGYLTFLLPVGGKLYVATAAQSGQQVFAEEVSPWEIISVLRSASESLLEA